ncbi:MAG: nitroreductase family protein [Rectinemataceae bacterium]
MNEVFNAILERRSVRAFKDEKIRKAELDAIIECGLFAPSANNSQNCHFTVIQNRSVVDKVNAWVLSEINKDGNPILQKVARDTGANVFRNAPCVILVSTEKRDSFGAINAAAATQNILLAAESFDIGSCWIGTVGVLAASRNAEDYAGELQIPEGYALQFGITLGYKLSHDQEIPKKRENAITYIA